MSLWDKSDDVERRFLRLLIRKFRLLQRQALAFDELNIMLRVNATYAEVDALCKEGFIAMLKKHRPDYGEEMFELWLLEQLEKYDPVTKYRWESEFERKRARLFEGLMADLLSKKPKSVLKHDIDVAMRYMERQFKQTADDLIAAFILQTYKDDGVKKVMWITARDEKVCKECAPRDRKVYDIDKCPQWPAHYYCRCEVVPAG